MAEDSKDNAAPQPDSNQNGSAQHGAPVRSDVIEAQPNVAPLTDTESDQQQDDAKNATPPTAKEGDADRWHFDRKLSVFDALLTVATLIGLLFLGFQSVELRRTNNLMADQVHTGQQAYVLVGAMTISEPQVGVHPTGALTIKNYGLTPATEVTIRALITITDKPLGTFAYTLKQGIGHIATLGASQEMGIRLDATKPISAEEMAAIVSGKSKLYVLGAIMFNDMFNRVNISEFCRAYDPELFLVSCVSHDGLTHLHKRPGPNESWRRQRDQR